MKYLVLILSGMADEMIDELDGRTPLEAAKTPNMDRLASQGKVGEARLTPERMKTTSDLSMFSLLGYDVRTEYPGKGVFQAAGLNVKLKKEDVAFACHLITENEGQVIDPFAGNIMHLEAKALFESLNGVFASRGIHFYPGQNGRHAAVFSDKANKYAFNDIELPPPYEMTDRRLSEVIPQNPSGQWISSLLEEAKEVLIKHDVNKVRIDLGENPGNMIWLWGQGRYRELANFVERKGFTAAIVSSLDVIRGIAAMTGIQFCHVPQKERPSLEEPLDLKLFADKALDVLRQKDIVFVYMDHTDHASYQNDYKQKIRIIEAFDYYVVGQIMERSLGLDYRMMITSNHCTPLSLRTHTDRPVPFLIWGRGIANDSIEKFHEKTAMSGVKIQDSTQLIDYFVGRK